MSAIFEVKYDDIPIRYQFRNSRTAIYFSGNIHLSDSDTYDIRMNDKEFQLFQEFYSEEIPDEYVEYKGLIHLTAEKLLSKKCCIFHAVSLYWNDKAWLFTGKSGIGKTTQYLNWDHIFPGEIAMISGDMPLIDFRGDKILVHPSPWNGKEGIRNNISAELGGIVILKQADYNTIEHTEIKSSIMSLFRQFMIIPRKEEYIHFVAGMLQRMIEEIPIWTFMNDGSEESTRVLRNALMKHLKNKEKQS